MLNDEILTLKLERREVCDLLLATLTVVPWEEFAGSKWNVLHDYLKDVLDEHAREHGYL